MKKNNAIFKLVKANNLIEDFKSAILSNVIIKIKDTKTQELLWYCHADEYYGHFKKEALEIEQDINMWAILTSLQKLLKDNK